jgi:hypothetical protein
VTAEEAEKILNIHRGASRQEIDTAYLLNRNHCMLRAQYDTCSKGRDQADQALILLQGAYRVLTGESATPQRPNNESPKPEPCDHIPRASLSGKIKPRTPTPRRRRLNMDRIGAMFKFQWPSSPENLVASFICVSMFLIALVVLAFVRR